MVRGLSWSLLVFPSAVEASQGLAERVRELAHEAVERQGKFVLGLSGGRTPVDLYTRLGTEYSARIPWAKTELCFADERAVPPTDPRSNFGLVDRVLLAPLGVPRPRVHRIAGERPPAEAAMAYDRELRALVHGPTDGPPEEPTFDLIVLGVGSDGHTASLFPNHATLREAKQWTVVDPDPALEPHVPRISLTLPAIRAARHAIFLVCGAEKQPVVQRIFNDPGRGTLSAELPSARVAARTSVEWYLDSTAAPRAGPGE